MIHTVIWLTVLGLMLFIPNAIAIHLALLGGRGPRPARPVAAAQPAPQAVQTPRVRRRAARGLLRFTRRGYLWKAFSPLLFGIAVVIGVAVGGVPGYVIMGIGLLNMIWGFLGWDGYVPGKPVVR